MKINITSCIVLYNNDIKMLEEAIASFLNTSLNVKLYLVDNSPTDKLKILVHNYKKDLNEEQLNNLCNIIHCYIHGEISKYLNNRIKVNEKTLKENIISNINLLCENIYKEDL